MVTHILGFSPEIGNRKSPDRRFFSLLPEASLTRNGNNIDFARKYNIDPATLISESKDIDGASFFQSKYKHIYPGYMLSDEANEKFPLATQFSLSGRADNVYAFAKLFCPGIHINLDYDTELFAFDKYINQYLPDDKLLILYDSQNHIETLATHLISFKDWNVNVDELEEQLVGVPMFIVHLAYTSGMTYAELVNYKDTIIQYISDNFVELDTTGIDVAKFTSSVEYYVSVVEKLGLTPNIEAYTNYTTNINVRPIVPILEEYISLVG